MKNSNVSCSEKVKDLSDFLSGVDYDLLSFSSDGSALGGYNFLHHKGALSDGYGVKNLSVKNGISVDRVVSMGDIVPSRLLCFTESVEGKTFLVVISNDYKVYTNYVGDISNAFNKIFEFDDMPNVFKYSFDNTNYLLFSSNQLFLIYDGTNANGVTIENSTKLFDICQHDKVLYLVLDTKYKNKILYSDDANPLNIQGGLSEMNCIDIPDDAGNIVKLISFDNYLYVFCEYGVYRYVTYETKKKNRLEQIYSGSNKIFGNTVVANGNKIMFFSTDGVYSCNGLKCEKIDLKIDRLIKNAVNSNAKAIIYGNKYFLACNLNFDDDEIVGCEVIPRKNTSLIVVDMIEEKACVCRGVGLIDVDNLKSDFDNKIMCISGYTTIVVGEISECGDCSPDCPVVKKWKAAFIDFDKPTKHKVCKYVSLRTISDIELKIVSNECEKIVNVSGSNNVQIVKADVKGRAFSIEILSKASGSRVSDLKMVVDIYD